MFTDRSQQSPEAHFTSGRMNLQVDGLQQGLEHNPGLPQSHSSPWSSSKLPHLHMQQLLDWNSKLRFKLRSRLTYWVDLKDKMILSLFLESWLNSVDCMNSSELMEHWEEKKKF
jgi:hypothetical protein